MREMKDSGISWVGEIPKEWNKRPIRSIIKSREGGVWGDDINDDIQGVVCIRIADFDFSKRKIKDVNSDLLTYRLYNSIQIQKYSLQKNDILIEKSGGGEKTPVGRAVLFDKNYKALFANFMDRIRIDDSIVLPLFAEYWLWNLYSCRVTPYYINQTIGIQNIDLTFMLAKEKICFPSLDEQQRIAEFLDRECGKIDGLKADIQAQIDTLEQYKRSVITEAVTHGLNPSAPMKDSGIPWVGNIPKHWNCCSLKYNYNTISGATPNSNDISLWDGEIVWVTPADYKTKDVYVFSGARKITYKGYLSCSTTLIKQGNIIFSKRAPIGSVAINKVELCTSQGCLSVVRKTGNVNNKYFYYLFSVNDETFNLFGFGTTFKEISAKDFLSVKFPLPPLDEQQEIADYLDNKCAEIEGIIEDKKSQIETLDGYKKSLIYEYVTGKKEVL